VDVRTQEDAIGDIVDVCVGPPDDMSGFEERQRVFSADSRLTMIGLGHFNAERPLALTDLTQSIVWCVVVVEGLRRTSGVAAVTTRLRSTCHTML